ncbi:MAG: carbohydrate porin [Psychromonas sp.]
MKKFKLLTTALAVAAALVSVPSFAADEDIAALEKRLNELETKLSADYVDTQQPAVLNAQTEAPLGVIFSGYARYGLGYQGSDSLYVGTDGSLNANATGRLGNEQNGGELQFSRAFESDDGAIWDIVFMLDHWSDASWADDGGVNVKKLYAGATGLFESQPNLYMWAGRDFHQRPQTDLDDYFWMSHDGQGGGFYNLELGGVKFDFSVVGQVEGDMVGDNGRYAATSKLHGMEIGAASLSFYANYGFQSDKIKDDANVADSAYQVAGELQAYGQKFIVRYSDNAKDSVFDLAEDQTALLFSLGGGYEFNEAVGIQYQTAYQELEGDAVEDRVNYNIIVRPTYQWNNVHSTWLEGGYSVVDYNDFDATNSSWKVTLSQNMAIGPKTWSRPMLRFYATVGNSDNEYSGTNQDGTYATRDEDTLTLGAMFEAWW